MSDDEGRYAEYHIGWQEGYAEAAAEIEKLRAALKPFADVLQDCTEDDYDDCDYVQVQYLYCREARASMEGEDD